jgi:hypothetical protein
VHTFAARKRDSGIVLITSQQHKKYILKYILDKLKRFIPLQSQNKRGKKSKAIFDLTTSKKSSQI